MTSFNFETKTSDRNWTVADRIGFYGCAGRLVRVGRHGQGGKPPVSVEVDCPACGQRHVARPIWRQRTEEDVEPEVALT